MLNKETARHDLATLYVGISRVTRLLDLKIWPIDCDKKRAIEHLVSIKRPGFISLWRKGYNDEGQWTRSKLAYTRLRAANELLSELHAAGDFKKNSMKDLRKLFAKCEFVRLDTKVAMAKRLQQKVNELIELINTGRLPPKRKECPSNAMASPQPKRHKRAARQRRGAVDAGAPKRKECPSNAIASPQPKRHKRAARQRRGAVDAGASSRPDTSGSRSRSRKRRHKARADSPPPQSSSSRRRSNSVTSTPASRALAARPELFA
jgi:hypothetical protein